MIRMLTTTTGTLKDLTLGDEQEVTLPQGTEIDGQHVRTEGEQAVVMIGTTLTLRVDRHAIRRL